MNCEQVEEVVLEGLNSQEAMLHLQSCSRCVDFVRVQNDLDARLQSVWSAPALSSGFDQNLRRRIRSARVKQFMEAYPEAAVMVSGVATTLVCVGLRPAWAASLALFGIVCTLIAALAPSLADWLTEELEG